MKRGKPRTEGNPQIKMSYIYIYIYIYSDSLELLVSTVLHTGITFYRIEQNHPKSFFHQIRANFEKFQYLNFCHFTGISPKIPNIMYLISP